MKPFLNLILLIFLCQNLLGQAPHCKDSSYRIRYINSEQFYTRDQATTSDNGTIMVGTITGSPTNVFVMKTDGDGEIVWSKKITAGSNPSFPVKVIQLSDGNFLIGGYFVYNDLRKNFLLKIDSNGNPIWNKIYQASSSFDPNDYSYLFSFSEGTNGEILTVWEGQHIYDDAIYDSSYAVVSRLNPSGDIIWSRAFISNDDIFTNPAGIFLQNNNIIVFGEVSDATINCPNYAGEFSQGVFFGMKLNESDGNLQMLKSYCQYTPTSNSGIFGDLSRFFSSRKLSNNNYSLFGIFGTTTAENFFAYRATFDDQLNLVSSYRYAIPRSLGNFFQANVSPNNDINITINAIASPQYFWCTLDSNNIIKRQRKIQINNTGGFAGYHSYGFKYPDVTTFSTNYGSGNQWYVEQIQLQPDDASIDSCLGVDTSFVITQQFNVLPSNWSWKEIVDNATVASDGNFTSIDITIGKENICKQVSSCDSIKISGKNAICAFEQSEDFTVYRNPDCNKHIQWSLDSMYFRSMTSVNDTTIRIFFKSPINKPDTCTLFALANNSCGAVKDSMQIILFPAPVSLTHDTSLCSGQTLRLSPGYWFQSYLWQDGSTDSIFTASQPGTYYVSVKTSCGYYFSDTVHITTPRLFNISQLTKCNSDTIELHAAAGLTNYSWLPDYHFIHTPDSVAFVYPDTTVTYSVTAHNPDGCIVTDTIRINVNHSPSIFLGNDTTFCTGDSVLLDAGGGFVSYYWNTNSVSQSIIVNQSGIYSIEATDTNGCISKDTLQILPLLPLPNISIHEQTILCRGQNDTLQVTDNSLTCLWQDGNTQNYYHVINPGSYWVQVKNLYGCTATDTAVIIKLYDPPSGFIFTDTTICKGTDLLLKPNEVFSKYNWSSGSNAPSIVVSNQGIYVLKVTDQFGCIGEQSIVVKLKDCPQSFYIPSAFSPNNDGKNDVFKPIITGILENYEFVIYDRWGQIVFKTKSKLEGWNGTLTGHPQNSGAFIWVCRYKFSNQPEETRKGTVLLIR